MNNSINKVPLAKGEDIIKRAGSNGKVEWLFVNNLHEIGGNRQREDRKTFASQEDAKEFFEEQAAKFSKMLGRSRGASVKQSESELLIYINGVQIVNMVYMAIPPQCV